MAKRFGGAHSPQPTAQAPAVAKPPRAAAGFRSRLMFFFPIPLLFRAFSALRAEDLSAALSALAAFVLLVLGAWLLRDGLLAEAHYNSRSRAARPALPRKILAALLAGAGVLTASFGSGAVFAIGLGLLVALLHVLAFGIDPLSAKGLDGTHNIDARRAAKVVADADLDVVAITAIADQSRDRQISDALRRFLGAVSQMLRTIEDDPRDLSQSRKFLSVYLKGARSAAEKYQALARRKADPAARDDLITLFDELSASFTAERAEMLLDDKADLDVEISVLQERLAYERPATRGK